MWTLDNSSIKLDASNVYLDGLVGSPPSDVSVPGRIRSEIITNTRILGQRGKLESALLIVLAVVGYTGSNEVHAAKSQVFEQRPDFIASWQPSPIITTLTQYPSDVVVGMDNYVGWPPPEPPFIQQQTTQPLVIDLQSYAGYNPAPDTFYKQFQRTPVFEEKPPFIQERLRSLINLTINPAPVGDLTTQLRKPQWFVESPRDDRKNPGAWHIVLLPQIGPQPPPPSPGPSPVWPLPSTIINLPCRGAWELPGGQQAVWVIGSGAFLMTVATPITGSAQATFKLKRIGTLNTSTGPVCIRDNGAPGGTVVIVDGPYGYYYTFSIAGAASSTAAVGDFKQITDPNFLGADRVAYIDGWWVFNQPGTQTFYTPDATYSLKFNGTNFALKDGATDYLVTLYENKEELWLIGEKTTEVWYDAGGQYFAFQRLVSTMLQVGCSAKHSIARLAGQEDGLAWLGKSERGQNVVVRTKGFGVTVISTPAINDAIASYTKIDDAIGYSYQEDGHAFYVLTFPSAVTPIGLGATWVFDDMTDMWHERLSYEPYSNQWNRHRSNCFLSFQNQRLVGDYQNGSIYKLNRQTYTDNGWPLVAWRRTPHVWDGGARERVYMASLQIEFSPGVGNQTQLGYDPQVVLTQSKDGGTTYGQEIRRSLGKVGQYIKRTIFRRLGVTRDTVFDVKVYDPVKRDVVGATLKRLDNGE